MTSRTAKFVNFIGFQVCWFACVFGAAAGHEWLGVAVVGLWSVACVLSHPNRARRVIALAAVALVGTAVDTLEMHAGWLHHAGTPLGGVFAPAWIVALWVAFATTYASSLAWLTRRLSWCALFGLFGAPLSYWGGVRAGAIEFGAPLTHSLIGVGITWAIGWPLSVALERRLRVA